MNHLQKIILAQFISLFMAMYLHAESVQDLYKRATPFPISQNLNMIFKMTIHEESGEKTRELQIQSVRKNETDKTVAKITSPSSLSGLKFLRIANSTQSVQTWLKTSRGVRRVADSASNNEKLFNSDFTIEDLTQNTITNHTIEALDTTETSLYWKIKDTDANGLVKIVSIKKENNIIETIEYLDKAGLNIKEYKVEEWAISNNLNYPKLIRMTDKVKKSWTTLEVIKIDTKTQILDSVFNASSL